MKILDANPEDYMLLIAGLMEYRVTDLKMDDQRKRLLAQLEQELEDVHGFKSVQRT